MCFTKFLTITIFTFVFSSVCIADINVTDDIGHTVSLKKPAKRIISLSPGMTELIFAAGGGEYIKGVVSYSDFPETAKAIPQIGSYNAIDLERIVSLAPDLVIAWESGNPPLQISKLKSLGLTVYMSEPRDFADIPATLIRLGKLMGTEHISSKRVTDFNFHLKNIESKYYGKFKEKSVFIQIWNKPVMSVNGQHLISKIIERCNGKNVFHDYSKLTLSPDVETVLSKNPEVIIVSRQGPLGESWLNRWKTWSFLNAVKNDQLYTANPDNLVRHTPRILDGMEEVCKLINK